MRYGDGFSPPELGGVRGGLSKGKFEGDQTTPDPSYSGGEIPIVISSGYRSEEVNMKCGGAKGSNHLTGCAVDIRCYGPEQMIRYACVLHRIALNITIERSFGMLDIVTIEIQRLVCIIHRNVWESRSRSIFCIDDINPKEDCFIHAIVEKRGKKEDKALKNYYEQLLERGTYWVHASRMQDRMESLEFRWKSEDVIGLQIADLVAYPLTRHVLNPEEVNYAYDIIKQNIYKRDGKLLGLKIFP